MILPQNNNNTKNIRITLKSYDKTSIDLIIQNIKNVIKKYSKGIVKIISLPNRKITRSARECHFIYKKHWKHMVIVLRKVVVDIVLNLSENSDFAKVLRGIEISAAVVAKLDVK